MPDITINTLNEMKRQGEKIAVLTSYDASFTRLIESAGVEVILVGDSLGMVIQGHESTLPVTVDEIVYHSKNVSRARTSAFLIADMPFMSYSSTAQALESAARLMKEGGAHMVKLEGGATQFNTVQELTANGIPVCAHLGLTPQSVHKLGGYKVQGRDVESARSMLDDAVALQQAGAQMLVLECIPRGLATDITQALDIPVIGIGAGAETDGQVLVVYDMLGISTDYLPKFSRNFMLQANTIKQALEAYVKAVKDGTYPNGDESYR
jgi:3-methyl-2-oxobutanoate hydroxymethyltransferase